MLSAPKMALRILESGYDVVGEVFIFEDRDDVIVIRHEGWIRDLFHEIINGLSLVCKDEPFPVRRIPSEHAAYCIGYELLYDDILFENQFAVFYLGFVFQDGYVFQRDIRGELVGKVVDIDEDVVESVGAVGVVGNFERV